MTAPAADPDDEVTCEALHLALSAIHLDIAWHAGVISAEAAMESLHQEIVETVSRCTRTNWCDRTRNVEPISSCLRLG